MHLCLSSVFSGPLLCKPAPGSPLLAAGLSQLLLPQKQLLSPPPHLYPENPAPMKQQRARWCGKWASALLQGEGGPSPE